MRIFLCAILILAAAAAPWIAPYGPTTPDYDNVLAGPSWEHLCGTDMFGRDIFSRILFGGCISLTVGFVSVALGGLVGGYPFGYMLCSGIALIVVPIWGWRSLYFLGVLPALLVLWIRLGIKESPRYEHVTTAMLKEGLRKRFDIWSPVREYPREMLIATLVYFFYLFTWIGWSAACARALCFARRVGELRPVDGRRGPRSPSGRA